VLNSCCLKNHSSPQCNPNSYCCFCRSHCIMKLSLPATSHSHSYNYLLQIHTTMPAQWCLSHPNGNHVNHKMDVLHFVGGS
jgi:hypothetical protein